MPKISLIAKLSLILLGIILFIFLFEVFVRITSIDIRLLEPMLYYQVFDTNAYVTSENANRLYSLRPNFFETIGYVHPSETKYQERKVTINSMGFRSQERNQKKSEGIYRIVVLGGSNTYGAAVSDNDTYPAIMQRMLDEKYPGKFEVWNAGLCGYVLSQKVAYAKEIIEAYNPDLLIIQHRNEGKRAFSLQEEGNVKGLIQLFNKNKELFKENVPSPFEKSSLSKAHNLLIGKSRVYGFMVIVFFRREYVGALEKGEPHYGSVGDSPTNVFGSSIHEKSQDYGQYINYRDFTNFVKEYKKIPILIFDSMGHWKECCSGNNTYWGAQCFSLCTYKLNLSEEYSDIHPPSYVYEWYAKELVDYLVSDLII